MYAGTLTALALAASALASPLLDQRAACTNTIRAAQLNGLAPAFSDMTPGAASRYLQQLPLKSDAKGVVAVNGLPGVPFGLDASTTRIEALLARQVFYKVTTTSNPATTNFPNGTSTTDVDVSLGPRVLPLPANAEANINYDYDLSDCTIKEVRIFLNLPSELLGRPLSGLGL